MEQELLAEKEAKGIVGTARTIIKEFKDICGKLLLPDSNKGAVLGIGFKGKIFGGSGSEYQHEKIYIGLSKKCRNNGGDLLLALTKHHASPPNLKSINLTITEANFDKYKNLIKSQLEKKAKDKLFRKFDPMQQHFEDFIKKIDVHYMIIIKKYNMLRE